MLALGLAVLMAAATASLLDRAIAAAGGAERLERYPAFEWKGRTARAEPATGKEIVEELDIDEFSPLPRLDPSLFEGPK